MNKEDNFSYIQLIATKDGSHSLINLLLDETYHSRHGAVQESLHVFIKNGLQAWLAQHSNPSVSIFEVGMGTGLNVLLTLQQALASDRLFYYTTLEPFPVTPEMILQLNYTEFIEDANLPQLFDKIHTCPWEQEVQLQNDFTFKKLQTTLQEVDLPAATFDVIYFDAFAANKQPEMWTYQMLEKVTSLLKPAGMWVTYAAKGQMKRDLKSLALEVETLPGPPGKAEMVRVKKASL
jgi:tRNA U34 5-methylaminomethyl-2-thiouridine-forming methyltransferase MnmC